MFTGIVEEIGTVKSIKRGAKSFTLCIAADKVLENTRIGDSIAANGVCLTVTSMGSGCYYADVMPETMRCTNFADLSVGSRLNLERAMAVGDRLGGHIVSGHIDGTGRVTNLERDDNAIWVTIAASPQIMKYIVMKGSIAIDGVSLTVAYVDSGTFKVSIIPHTQEQTTLTSKKVGDIVNLENDILARYVEKLMQKQGGGLSLEFLKENGF